MTDFTECNAAFEPWWYEYSTAKGYQTDVLKEPHLLAFRACWQRRQGEIEGWKQDQKENLAIIFAETAHANELKAALAAANAKLGAITLTLVNLCNDCLASDFNERWDSYKQAESLLPKPTREG